MWLRMRIAMNRAKRSGEEVTHHIQPIQHTMQDTHDAPQHDTQQRTKHTTQNARHSTRNTQTITITHPDHTAHHSMWVLPRLLSVKVKKFTQARVHSGGVHDDSLEGVKCLVLNKNRNLIRTKMGTSAGINHAVRPCSLHQQAKIF